MKPARGLEEDGTSAGPHDEGPAVIEAAIPSLTVSAKENETSRRLDAVLSRLQKVLSEESKRAVTTMVTRTSQTDLGKHKSTDGLLLRPA